MSDEPRDHWADAPYDFPLLEFEEDLLHRPCAHDARATISLCRTCTTALFWHYRDLGVISRTACGVSLAGGSPAEQLAWLELALEESAVSGTLPPSQQGQWRPPVRWPSTIGYVDNAQGGCTGLTTVIGNAKVGKSRLAMASGLRAAAAGFAVIWLNGEMSVDDADMRWDELVRVDPAMAASARSRFWRVDCPPGFTIGSVHDFVLDQMATVGDELWPRRLLLIPDSVNTLAELAGGRFYDTIRRLSMWAMQSRKLSRGAVSWLCVSEMNYRGGARGVNLDFKSDLVIKLERQQEDPTVVDVSVPYSRHGPAQPALAHRLDMDRGGFVVASEEEMRRA